MARGIVYLCAVVDWFSRRVLSWRLSITMEAAFCIEAVEEALIRYGKPDIFNTDQGSQFTSVDFTAVLKKADIAISMDGEGAWRDNVFVERLWRSIKYEELYLHAYKTVTEARAGIGRYLTFYNSRRPHCPSRESGDSSYRRHGLHFLPFRRSAIRRPIALQPKGDAVPAKFAEPERYRSADHGRHFEPAFGCARFCARSP